jgi:Protein of unknown function (DUF3592)
MQRLFARVAAHFFSSAALQSDTTIPVSTERDAPWSQRFAYSLARFLERCESSPHLLGEEKAQDALVITFLTAFSMIGWLMLMQGYEQLRQAHAIERWPTTAGTILAVDMQAADSGQGTHWRPQVTYTYTVHGRVITATRITPGKTPSIEDEIQARDYVGHYLPQTPVQVHYNPVDIADSVLEPATPRSAYLNLTLGTGLAVLGPALFMLIGMPISRRRGWLFWRRP